MVLLVLLAYANVRGGTASVVLLGACVLLYSVWISLHSWLVARKCALAYTECLGECRLTLSAAGLELESHAALAETRFSWPGVTGVEENPGWLAVIIGPVKQILPVPETAFADAAQRQDFLDALKTGMGRGAMPPSETNDPASPETGAAPACSASAQDAAATPAPPAGARWPGRLASGLGSLWRVFTFRLPRPAAFEPGVIKLILPIPLFFLITLGLEIAAKGHPGSLVYYNLARVLSPFATIAVITGLAMLMRAERQENFWREGARVLMALNWLLLLLPLNYWWLEGALFTKWLELDLTESDAARSFLIIYGSVPGLWFMLAGLRQSVTLGEPGRLKTNLGLMFVAIALSTAFSLHAQAPMLWYADSSDDDDDDGSWVKLNEDVLYGQPRLLAEHLDRVQDGRPGEAEIFFLGVGGDGHQNVFLRETQSVEQLFHERFQTQGRSLVLVNNVASIDSLPVANHESLQQALTRIGQRMNGEEDLLFLFMTSHGSRDHRFSLSFWPFSFSDITPPMLRQALDKAGIKRRVLVVSACYSGGFVPALEDDYTLVITASAADRNSFGCSDRNEWTDFGRAYFDEALRQTRSFTEAFELAATRIAEREQAAGHTPSLPQMRGGEKLKAQLDAFARSPAFQND
ncbi:MAG: C13 family peptidase [Candidatus Accumulibacter sp.]|nr:C13 family peptidase [Accumulibacter sp.]